MAQGKCFQSIVIVLYVCGNVTSQAPQCLYHIQDWIVRLVPDTLEISLRIKFSNDFKDTDSQGETKW